jgi:hypothetical protein
MNCYAARLPYRCIDTLPHCRAAMAMRCSSNARVICGLGAVPKRSEMNFGGFGCASLAHCEPVERPYGGELVCRVGRMGEGAGGWGSAVNTLRLLGGRWMRMFTMPNQSSVAKVFQEFNANGRMKPSAYYDRISAI